MNGRGKTRIALAYTISGLGDSIIPASFAIQSYRLDESGRLLTIVLLSLWLGRLLSFIAAQRLPAPTFPARWMILSDVVRMLAQLLLLWWVVAQSSHFAMAFFVSCLSYGLATAFFNPARFELISIVCETEKEKVCLNSLLSAVGDVLFVCGPLIGTFITVRGSFETALLVDSLTFAVSILILASFCRSHAEHIARQRRSLTQKKSFPHGSTRVSPPGSYYPPPSVSSARPHRPLSCSTSTSACGAGLPPVPPPGLLQDPQAPWS